MVLVLVLVYVGGCIFSAGRAAVVVGGAGSAACSCDTLGSDRKPPPTPTRKQEAVFSMDEKTKDQNTEIRSLVAFWFEHLKILYHSSTSKCIRSTSYGVQQIAVLRI